MNLVLYGTSACHLCELAEDLLRESGRDFELVDIAGSDALFERYGVTIPVLRRDDGQELNWPFDAEALAQFLGRA